MSPVGSKHVNLYHSWAQGLGRHKYTHFNANDFFLNAAGDPRPVLQENQFGGSFGAAVPKLHDTFFFVTESVLMQHLESSASVLSMLKCIGVRLAVDDFRAGYSSLGYLKKFPIDSLSIDQSFMHGITTDTDDATIVRAVITMAKTLK